MDNEPLVNPLDEVKKALHDALDPVCDHPDFVESVTVRFKPSKLVKELLKSKPEPKE
ncbi:MAG: hypothetical protein IKH75_01280 [Ruminococcus sp.]|nr:hypothetical protein [Ruminococcus sp.]